jgi:hypothetical protein
MLSGKSISWKVLKVESVDVFRSHAEAAAGQYVKHSRGLNHHHLRDKRARGLCVKLPAFFGRSGDGCFSTASRSIAKLNEFGNLLRTVLRGD